MAESSEWIQKYKKGVGAMIVIVSFYDQVVKVGEGRVELGVSVPYHFRVAK